MKHRLIYSLLCTVVLGAVTATVRANPIKVLHVSEVMKDEVQKLIKGVGAGDLFDVTQISLHDEYNWIPPEDLEAYDVVVLGLSDCFDVVRSLDELYWFVHDGGGVVFTHDSAAHISPPAVKSMIGVGGWIDPDNWVWGNSAEIVQDHDLLNALFEIGHVGESVDIQQTHPVFTLNSGDEILKLVGYDGREDWYLSVKEFGAGRIVLSQIGHSVYQCEGQPGEEAPAPFEETLFVNCLYWAGTDTPLERCNDLIAQVLELDLPKGTENGLMAKLQNVARKLNEQNDRTAVNVLGAFINAVVAQSGKKIAQEDAEALILAAQDILVLLVLSE